MPFEIDRHRYAGTYGPTAGDRIRLGDTNIVAEVESDSTQYGEEALLGWGKNIRAGMLMSHRRTRASDLDYVIAGVVIVDPVLGVLKGSIGVKDGLITGIGRAGSGDIMDGVDLEIGANTVIVNGVGMIATPGGVDSHVHIVTPRVVETALASGITTLIGGGVFDNGRLILQRSFEAFEHLPVNVGLQASGSATSPFPMEESIEAGACGFKIHEDLGAYGNVIDTCLRIAEQADVSVALHTDGLQESADVRGTIEAIDGRAVHAYHIEGAGGGHAPDLLTMAGVDNIIPSSTTPTVPYSVGTFQEHFAMTAICHLLDLSIPSDAAALGGRLRRQTMAAEDVLHDLGAIPVINSDSQGMGRIGEVITRTWQLAHKMKAERGAANPDNDNDRIRQYIAKYTINPAITHGIADYVGSLEAGKMADVVLWLPAFFGIKPEVVMKGGFVTWGPMGEGNATVPGSEPTSYGPMFGGIGINPSALSALFVSSDSIESGLDRRLRTARSLRPVTGVRTVRKGAMLHNSVSPHIEVDGQAAQVTVDDVPVTSEAVTQVPLNRLYRLT